ncbi:hypothetical protein Lqui_0015 [Legionella quinlivanii]|uniref:Uncharacterized protein n=1 Tax=Legionella quinlivanii TaxID=45073 RepID=A0A0W0Y8V9_9GAMM|nr:hypothetical protein [Legionella quinlivanii]KTD53060.1 hypothetical protein Lqui_0015 [Legionella quinlivanii]MCW8451362.1 hypothetical protein [Legionella quinlivanii]SEG16509.1 hypothetical protein SAMN02746093_02058 [Legionella quinlivanii DSM 21216]STY10440.1 Uncharacterised protein [Legionella quinlivanii]
MNKDWPTRDKDMYTAQVIMEEYANKNKSEALGLFELVVDKEEKRMNFRISGWVRTLAEYFKSVYGANQGDFVTRQVISHCLTKGETIH